MRISCINEYECFGIGLDNETSHIAYRFTRQYNHFEVMVEKFGKFVEYLYSHDDLRTIAINYVSRKHEIVGG